MRDEVKIFDSNNITDIHRYEKENTTDDLMGYVYIIEWDNKVKIGSSSQIEQRVKTLKRNGEIYGNCHLGRIGISPAHTNYYENEKMLHAYFADCRIETTELFQIPFDDIILSIPDTILYKNEVVELKEKHEKASEGLIKLVKTIHGTETEYSIQEINSLLPYLEMITGMLRNLKSVKEEKLKLEKENKELIEKRRKLDSILKNLKSKLN